MQCKAGYYLDPAGKCQSCSKAITDSKCWNCQYDVTQKKPVCTKVPYWLFSLIRLCLFTID